MRRAQGGPLKACCVLGCLLRAPSIAASPAPDLSATALYTTVVHGCRPVDLRVWRHPVREVLHSARARVEKVELCNEGRLPVFTVRLPYDVDAEADRYPNRLYAAVAEANGLWSYALVDLANDVVITAAVERSSRTVSPTHENPRGPAGVSE